MKDTMIGVDLAKNVFQLHAASIAGHVKFRKKLSQGQFFRFMSEQAPALVVMEACAITPRTKATWRVLKKVPRHTGSNQRQAPEERRD